MQRRSFFQQFLALLGLSPGVGGIAAIAGAPSIPSAATGFPASVGPPPECSCQGLEAWLRLPMTPLHRPEDFEDCPDLQTRLLAATLLARLSAGRPFAFRYLGGSEAGAVRSVLPVLLFRKLAPDRAAGPPRQDPVYLLAHCQASQAPRTFRLDRMEPVHPNASLN